MSKRKKSHDLSKSKRRQHEAQPVRARSPLPCRGKRQPESATYGDASRAKTFEPAPEAASFAVAYPGAARCLESAYSLTPEELAEISSLSAPSEEKYTAWSGPFSLEPLRPGRSEETDQLFSIKDEVDFEKPADVEQKSGETFQERFGRECFALQTPFCGSVKGEKFTRPEKPPETASEGMVLCLDNVERHSRMLHGPPLQHGKWGDGSSDHLVESTFGPAYGVNPEECVLIDGTPSEIRSSIRQALMNNHVPVYPDGADHHVDGNSTVVVLSPWSEPGGGRFAHVARCSHPEESGGVFYICSGFNQEGGRNNMRHGNDKEINKKRCKECTQANGNEEVFHGAIATDLLPRGLIAISSPGCSAETIRCASTVVATRSATGRVKVLRKRVHATSIYTQDPASNIPEWAKLDARQLTAPTRSDYHEDLSKFYDRDQYNAIRRVYKLLKPHAVVEMCRNSDADVAEAERLRFELPGAHYPSCAIGGDMSKIPLSDVLDYIACGSRNNSETMAFVRGLWKPRLIGESKTRIGVQIAQLIHDLKKRKSKIPKSREVPDVYCDPGPLMRVIGTGNRPPKAPAC